MTEKDLKKLTRTDLLEMLIEQSKQMQELQEKLDAAEEKLTQRELAIENAGSIAEASLRLNGVFEAAQAACQQYMDNIQSLSDRQTAVCDRMEATSREAASRLLADATAKAQAIELDGKRKYTEMITKAKSESEAYWESVSRRLEAFYAEHAGLRELLSTALPSQEQL